MSRALWGKLAFGAALSVLAVMAILSLFLAVEKRVAAAAPSYRVTPIGGMEYEAMNARPIDPRNAVDRHIIAGLPARDRHLRHGQILFGAFISFTNASSRPLRSAQRIQLRIDAGRLYRPLRLPVSNPYAYSARLVRPRSRIPGAGSVADDNLAATGRLLLFRIPARPYRSGATFELVIHQGRRTATLLI